MTPGEARDLLLEALSRAPSVFVLLDATTAGTRVPEALCKTMLALEIGYDMPTPIPDLKVGDEGISAYVPWAAVSALQVRLDLQPRPAAPPAPARPESTPSRRSHLKLV